MLRSDSIWGTYEDCPFNPIISSGQKDCLLQRAGHMQVIEGMDGRWYMAYLCSRPLDNFSILGRETALQNVEWTEDGWLRLSANDTATPEGWFDVPDANENSRPKIWKYDFQDGKIPLDFLTLRNSFTANGISVRQNKLHIQGGCSLMSKYHQGFLARTQESLDCDFSAVMEFEPRRLNHLAGIAVYYNYDNYYQLRITRDEKGKKAEVCSVVNQEMNCSDPVYLPEEERTYRLTARIRQRDLQFYLELKDNEEIPVGKILDMRNISDEHVKGNGFTGSMLGVGCIDVQGDGVSADFTEIIYEEY